MPDLSCTTPLGERFEHESCGAIKKQKERKNGSKNKWVKKKKKKHI